MTKGILNAFGGTVSPLPKEEMRYKQSGCFYFVNIEKSQHCYENVVSITGGGVKALSLGGIHFSPPLHSHSGEGAKEPYK